MRITELELIGYKRMKLNGVNRILYRPKERAQVILGTNGSGKSSLVHELSPLPPNPSDYLKEGSKTIRIVKGKNTYKLKTVFAPTTRHSFEKDAEELNQGGTATVQRDLIYQEFGITKQSHELSVGLENFTNMSPARRREWFTLMSDVDYSYALEVFSKLKERGRDTSGALKLAKKRIVTETAKLISEAEEEKLREETKALEKELTQLQELRSPVTSNIEELKDLNKHRLQELHNYGTLLNRCEEIVKRSREFTSIEDIENQIYNLNHKVTATDARNNVEVAEYDRLDKIAELLRKTGEAGVTELKLRLECYLNEQKRIQNSFILPIKYESPTLSKNVLETIRETLIDVFTEIPDNSDKRFNSTNYNELKQSLLNKKEELLYLNKCNAETNAKLSHIESHRNKGETQCPKCKHTWTIGFSEETVENLKKNLIEQEEKIKVVNETINDFNLKLDEFDKYRSLYSNFSRCVKLSPTLSGFWDYLITNNLLIDTPRQCLSLVHTLSLDLDKAIESEKLEVEIRETNNLIEQASIVGDSNLNEVLLQMSVIEKRINENTKELTTVKELVGNLEKLRKSFLDSLRLKEKINGVLNQVEETTDELVEMLRRETLNRCIQKLQMTYAMKSEALSSAVLQKEIVNDIQKNIDSLSVEDQAIKVLLQELSPTEGLIAEGLMGFIRSFISQMNNVIRKIWSYPLQVLECKSGDENNVELNYEFPLMVQHKDNVVPDVKLGSTGMREIVNLAFKIVAMKYMRLEHASLVLDEFGNTMDAQHRVNAAEVIKTIMDSSSFSQLFMISHDYQQYTAFTNAEVCVLCSNNIIVPDKYNQHVVIE